jgi:hypothetical protein
MRILAARCPHATEPLLAPPALAVVVLGVWVCAAAGQIGGGRRGLVWRERDWVETREGEESAGREKRI